MIKSCKVKKLAMLAGFLLVIAVVVHVLFTSLAMLLPREEELTLLKLDRRFDEGMFLLSQTNLCGFSKKISGVWKIYIFEKDMRNIMKVI